MADVGTGNLVIRKWRRSYEHPCGAQGPLWTVAVRDDEVSVRQAASDLGIPADAIYNWLAHGQVPARRGPAGRWCIPWDPDTQAIYRQKVANSVQLKPALAAQQTAGTHAPPHDPPP